MKVFNRRAIDVDEVVESLLSYADRLRPMVADTALEIHRALERGETVLFEAGQATMLDVDHGTYPFVTSSSATAGGAATGSGIGPGKLERIIGIVKAYTTRVGAGPFPTELFDESGEFLRANGFEFGTTTGRPRRCGWYDAPIARYTARINGVTDFVLTKLDVLTGLETIPVCVAYEVDGVRVDEVPVNSRTSTTRSRSTRSSPAGPRTSPAPARSTTCRRTRRTTSWRSRRCPVHGSRPSASAPP